MNNILKLVGYAENGLPVYISGQAMNRSEVLVGMSGAGKTTRVLQQEKADLESGGTVIDIDINANRNECLELYHNRIDARNDGIPVSLIDPVTINNGQDSVVSQVASALEIVSSGYRLGVRQQEVLRDALYYALENRNSYDSELSAVKQYLIEHKGEKAADTLYGNMYVLLEENLFRPGFKQFERGKINILSFGGIDSKTQSTAIEIVLSSLWRNIRNQKMSEGELTIVLDEFQNLKFSRNSVLYQMLTEGRKYNLRLILATQTLSVFSKQELAALNQAAVRLYFRQIPSDARQAAELIDARSGKSLITALKELPLGAAITTGDLCMSNGKAISGRLTTYSEKLARQRNTPGLMNMTTRWF